LLACFVPVSRAPLPERSTDPEAEDDASRIAKLEATLDVTRKDEDLHDLELEVEAHAADTAEALSVNEEFQSTNEELLASKEELQAWNEELTALNASCRKPWSGTARQPMICRTCSTAPMWRSCSSMRT